MGPYVVADHLEMLVVLCEKLLDKETHCQLKASDMAEDDDEENDDSDGGDSDDDRDHDEIILGGTTDMVISLAKCLND